MKYFFYSILLVSFSSFAALTTEDLERTFLKSEKQRSLTVKELEYIESALHEIGEVEVFNSLRRKIATDKMEALSLYVQACNSLTDALGTYTRSKKTYRNKTIKFQDDINNLKAFWGETNVLKDIEKSYKWYIENNGAYASLVIQSWPVICIRPNMKFKDVLLTFAHEVKHFTGDNGKENHFSHFENEDDYIAKRLMKSGGEFEAFQVTARVSISLFNYFNTGFDFFLLRFFDNEGNLTDSKGLQQYILQSLGYLKGFSKNYRDHILYEFHKKQHQQKSLKRYLEVYRRNKRISLHKKSLIENEFKRSQNTSLKEDILHLKKAVTFYKNMISITDGQLHLLENNLKRHKEKINNINFNQDNKKEQL